MNIIELRAETKYTNEKDAIQAIRHLYDKSKMLAMSFRLTFMKEYTPKGNTHRSYKTQNILLVFTDADAVLRKDSEGMDIMARHLRDLREGLCL